MRPRGSIISQLLIAFCVFAVLIGVAAAAVYVAVAQQNTTTKQLSGEYTVLQQANSALEFEFGTAEFSIYYYRLTGQRAYLLDFAPAKVGFERQLGILQHHAIPSVRGLVARQASTSTAWFALAPQLISVKPGTKADAALLAKTLRFADGFATATTTMQGRLYDGVGRLAARSKQALGSGLAWSGAALAVAVMLVLAASLSTVYSITRPLRGVTATVRKLTAGRPRGPGPGGWLGGGARGRRVGQRTGRRERPAAGPGGGKQPAARPGQGARAAHQRAPWSSPRCSAPGAPRWSRSSTPTSCTCG